MSVEKTEALVIGAGQAGIAASEHLRANGIPHLVLRAETDRRALAVGAVGFARRERPGLA